MTTRTHILAALLAVTAGLAAWYHFGRPSLLQAACSAGLPNFSRPAGIAPTDLGCAILAQKARYSGVLMRGFEASNFSSPDFPTISGQSESVDQRSWFHCPKAGCGKELENQLDRKYDCLGDRTGVATITVEGWVTVSEGKFGHLGLFPRAFYAERIVNVSPAPDAMIQNWVTTFRQKGLCQQTGPTAEQP